MSNRCRTEPPVKIETGELVEPATKSEQNQRPSKLPAELKRIADHNAIGVKEAPTRSKRKSRKPKPLTYDNHGCIVLDEEDGDDDTSDTEAVPIKREEDMVDTVQVPIKKEDDIVDVCKPAARKTTAPPNRGWAWLVANDGSPIVFGCAQQAAMTRTMRKRLLEGHAAATTSRKKPKIESPPTLSGAVDSDEEEYSSSSSDEEYSSDRLDDEVDDDDDDPQCSTYAGCLQAQWDGKFDLLLKYKDKYKTANVPRRTKILGRWVQHQRWNYKQGTLDKERIVRLESIGFEWELVATYKHHWMIMYNRLVAYKKKYNSTCVPAKWKKDPQLGHWVVNQRQRCKEKNRINLLNKIGFEWKPSDKIKNHWMVMYKLLVAYKKKHNTTCVPQKWKQDPQLGHWVDWQRHFCKEKDRVDLLNKIGFEWKPSIKVKNHWMVMYKRLVAYKKKYNSTRVPQKWKKDPQLGCWVNKQRQSCKEKDRVDLLNKIGFEWKSPDKIKNHWMVMYKRLVAYKKKYNSTRVPQKWKKDPQLGHWVDWQRHFCKKKNRVDLLNKIGFEWKPFDSHWMVMYKRLVAYKKKYHSTCVPQRWEKDPQLGRWVKKQRQRCKEKNRVDLLNKIGFEWKPLIKVKNHWMVMYKRLVAYKKKYHSTCVPRDWEKDPQLAAWVDWQRHFCKEKDRVDLLNKIGFEWKPLDNHWMVMYERLVAYKKKHNSTCVPFKRKKDPQLGHWVDWQRHFCKEKNRVDLLNKIGFEWKPSIKVKNHWMVRYKSLVAYKKEYHSTCVPRDWEKDPQLGQWVAKQRQCCKEPDRVDLLNKIGFEWKPSEKVKTHWMVMYKRLMAYKKKYKSTCVPRGWGKDPQLGNWVHTQRKYCKENHRIDLLNSIDFTWVVKR